MKKEVSPLLALLDQRWKDVIQSIPDPTPDRPHKRPEYPPDFGPALLGIAKDHSEADNSDPFAAKRARHYMRQGYWLPSEVRADAHSRTSARRSQGITFPAVRLAA